MRKSRLSEADDMLLHDVLPEFATWLNTTENSAIETRKTYLTKLRAVERWLGPTPTLADVTEVALRRFHTEMGTRLANNTVRVSLFACRTFGRWMVERGYCEVNPAASVEAPHPNEPHRVVPTDAEVTALLDACGRLVDPYRVLLARALVSTLIYGGMRRNELLQIHVKHVDLRRGEVLIARAKGGSSYTCCPHQDAITAIREYLRVRYPIEGGWLWAQDRARRLGDEGLRHLLDELCCIAGMPDYEGLQPHGIRHNFAMRLLIGGANLHDVSMALNHSSITTTADIYLHRSMTRLHHVADKAALRPDPKQALPQPANKPAQEVRTPKRARVEIRKRSR